MTIGDLVKLKKPLSPERYGVALIQKVFPALEEYRDVSAFHDLGVYHVRWCEDDDVTIHNGHEIEMVSTG